jgi:lipoprotein-releasing system ATP-binding protein
MSETVLEMIDINKKYSQINSDCLEILTNVNFKLVKGELVGLFSPSGSGKTTLLQIAGLLDKPSSGNLKIDGVDTNKLTDTEKTLIRRKKIGFIYQFHHLLPEFTASENVSIPQWTLGVSRKDAQVRALSLLDRVGLLERSSHRPGELSGGEQQRVALCRALVNQPKILLADEPTGNLDSTTSDTAFDILVKLVRESELACLIVTHNLELAKKMDRVLHINEKTLKKLVL